MGVGEVVGGVAVVGILVLVGLAIIADDDPQSLTTQQSVVLSGTDTGAGSTTTAAATTATTATTEAAVATTEATPPEGTTASEPTPAETDPPDTTASPTTEPAATEPTRRPTTTSAPVNTLPADLRSDIAVRVLNAGTDEGAADFVSGVLKQTGFEPLDPNDAAAGVEGTIVMYGPGLAAEGATVNAVIATPPEKLVEARPGDPNWAAFGDGIDVLVLLGPS